MSCVREHDWALNDLLPLFTSNAAKILKLPAKGTLEAGKAADVVVLDRKTLTIVHLFARGRHMIKDGELVVISKQAQQIAQGKE